LGCALMDYNRPDERGWNFSGYLFKKGYNSLLFYYPNPTRSKIRKCIWYGDTLPKKNVF